MGAGEIGPGLDALGFHRAAHQLMAQFDGRLLTVLLVAGADFLPLDVGHQRQIDHAGECAL
jgi:hypothetical protein